MNAVAMQSFGFGDQLVRVHDRDGSAWFVGKDVCQALELANSNQSLARLEDDERDEVHITDPIGREQRTTIISESGVYALIFTSRKEAAKRFRRWVTQDVLPAIRMTGRYEVPSNDIEPIAELEAPDDFDRIRTNLALVREVRTVFGLRAARRAWAATGLMPEVTQDWTDGPLHAPIGVIAKMHRSVADWLDARTIPAAGHREGTTTLYDDYLRWAKSEEVSKNDVVSLTAFGKVLTNAGVGSVRSNRVYRVGLALKPTD